MRTASRAPLNKALERMESLRELERHLLSLEGRLLQPGTRGDTTELETLLDDDFVEFGSSGRVFDRPSIIAALRGETPAQHQISEFKLRSLVENVAFVTYRLRREAPGHAPIESLRSSVWKRVNGTWKMAFHQGTRAAAG